ncbi:glycosyltransferase family 4 protein [Caldalkalibacillus salinus]|uniref:glycosyltransferase family 4 protein n=1 Tax=Caldalkalibacillus salinus TaxID=2803787 RepID=UPI0019223C26|nr:glycosyltransferase family 4 protein [Caldalkalibacillus salinus]
MKTIWFISHSAMPPHLAVRTRTNKFAKYLTKKGYNVEIFAASTIHNSDINLINDNSTLFIEKEYEGVKYNHIRTSNYSGNGISRIINMLQFPFRLSKVSKKKKVKPDVIICNPQSVFAVIPYLISKKIDSKFILDVRDLWTESIVDFLGYSQKNPIIQFLYSVEKWVFKKSDKIIFSMEGGKDYLIDRGINKKMSLSKVHHITNGFDLDDFNYNKLNYPLNDDLLENKDIFKVVYTGAIREANNISFLVDTAKEIQNSGIKDIQFLIYGEGPDKRKLEERCKRENINNIHFKGQVEKKFIPYILSTSNLNLLNYKQVNTWKYGGSQNKLSEYIASGKPTLSSIDMNYNQIKKFNCGKICSTNDPNDFAKEIISFYEMSSEKYAVYCNNAEKASQELDYKKLVDKLEEIILEA